MGIGKLMTYLAENNEEEILENVHRHIRADARHLAEMLIDEGCSNSDTREIVEAYIAEASAKAKRRTRKLAKGAAEKKPAPAPEAPEAPEVRPDYWKSRESKRYNPSFKFSWEDEKVKDKDGKEISRWEALKNAAKDWKFTDPGDQQIRDMIAIAIRRRRKHGEGAAAQALKKAFKRQLRKEINRELGRPIKGALPRTKGEKGGMLKELKKLPNGAEVAQRAMDKVIARSTRPGKQSRFTTKHPTTGASAVERLRAGHEMPGGKGSKGKKRALRPTWISKFGI